MDITFEKETIQWSSDSEDGALLDPEANSLSSMGCYLCQPHIYGPQANETKNETIDNISDDSIKQEYISSLRRKCKAELKKANSKQQKMMLDNNLRLSYK